MVALLGCPEDAPSQVADGPLDLAPVNGVPVGSPSLGSVCKAFDPHPTFTLRLASFTTLFGRLTRIASAPFRVRPIGPIRRVMVSPCLSAAGVRFSILPSPAGDLDFPHGRLTAILFGGPHRGLHVPHEGGAVGVGASCTPGPSVFMSGYGRNPGPSTIQHHRINQAFGDLA